MMPLCCTDGWCGNDAGHVRSSATVHPAPVGMLAVSQAAVQEVRITEDSLLPGTRARSVGTMIGCRLSQNETWTVAAACLGTTMLGGVSRSVVRSRDPHARTLERWHTFCSLSPARSLTVRDHRPPCLAVSHGEVLPEDVATPGIGHGSPV